VIAKVLNNATEGEPNEKRIVNTSIILEPRKEWKYETWRRNDCLCLFGPYSKIRLKMTRDIELQFEGGGRGSERGGKVEQECDYDYCVIRCGCDMEEY
jgi:hypothetical protein